MLGFHNHVFGLLATAFSLPAVILLAILTKGSYGKVLVYGTSASKRTTDLADAPAPHIVRSVCARTPFGAVGKCPELPQRAGCLDLGGGLGLSPLGHLVVEWFDALILLLSHVQQKVLVV